MDIARSCVSALLAVAVCGCGGSEDRTGGDASAALDEASSGEVAQARAYIGQFTTEDPDHCFEDVALEQPELERRSGDGIGPRIAPVRVVVAIDGSGSMAGRIGGQSKLELAREAATR